MATCPSSGQVCVTVTSCSLSTGLSGTIEVTQEGTSTPVGSCNFSGGVTGMGSSTVGTGYTPGSHPNVAITGGGGSGATATTTATASGTVTSYTVTNPGSGYTSVPTVTVDPPPAGGTQAVAVATVTSKCCVAVPQAGRYLVKATVPGHVVNPAVATVNCAPVNFSIDAPPSTTTVIVRVIGCIPNFGVQGATVTATKTLGGAAVGTAVTDASGYATLVVPSNVSITYSATKARFGVGSVFGSVCGNGTVNFPNVIQLPTAPGYGCFGCCVDPLPLTLHLTDSVFGAITITSAAGGQWTAQIFASVSGCEGCPAATNVRVQYRMGVSGSQCVMFVTYSGTENLVSVPGNESCFCDDNQATSPGGGSYSFDLASLTCPVSGSFASTWTLPPTAVLYCGGATITVSE